MSHYIKNIIPLQLNIEKDVKILYKLTFDYNIEHTNIKIKNRILHSLVNNSDIQGTTDSIDAVLAFNIQHNISNAVVDKLNTIFQTGVLVIQRGKKWKPTISEMSEYKIKNQ